MCTQRRSTKSQLISRCGAGIEAQALARRTAKAKGSCTPPAPSGDSDSETRGNPGQAHSHTVPSRASHRQRDLNSICLASGDSDLECRVGAGRKYNLRSCLNSGSNLSRENGLDRPSPAARARLVENPALWQLHDTQVSLQPKAQPFFGQLAKLRSPPEPQPNRKAAVVTLPTPSGGIRLLAAPLPSPPCPLRD